MDDRRRSERSDERMSENRRRALHRACADRHAVGQHFRDTVQVDKSGGYDEHMENLVALELKFQRRDEITS